MRISKEDEKSETDEFGLPSHHVGVFALEDDNLLLHAGAGLAGREPNENVLASENQQHQKELVRDLSTGGIEHGRVAGSDQCDYSDERRNETH